MNSGKNLKINAHFKISGEKKFYMIIVSQKTKVLRNISLIINSIKKIKNGNQKSLR